jgi:trafficking protein particle complex subunit 10
VEYFDPSGVFPLVSAGLLSRLPLRNLHWKSPSRPLRSISSLHVDLVPYGQLQQLPQSPPGVSGAKSEESIRGIGDALARPQSTRPSAGERGTTTGPVKERRHQIPGLRRTPYLKIFLLRCDDADAYKATARKQLREWIKEHATPPSQSTTSVSGQENHDAFEWLIVHVVLPNTAAATQPHTSSSSGNGTGSGAEKAPGTSRWPGRGTSSILDKIRSDFNGSSKSAKDRVAQIRVQKGPELSVLTLSADEAPRDQESPWSDLISKFKSLILTSFDLRVSQYEEDIREKDAQRSLPGWNFCTFFVLKEGLARGFESVGLVEDALVGYDELAVGLDAIIRDQTSGEGQTGTFLAYTEDLWQRAVAARSLSGRSTAVLSSEESKTDQGGTDLLEDETSASLPLSAINKPYRDLILSNNISVFDFRCYIFARQLCLLLRLGNALSSRSGLMAKLRTHPATEGSEYSLSDDGHEAAVAESDNGSEDLITLAEVCKRGIEFITSVSRVMRSDLWNAYHAKLGGNLGKECSNGGREIGRIINNLVSSWTFSLTQQILAETSTKAIPIPLTSVPDTNSSSAKIASPGGPIQEPKAAIAEPKTMMHPARTSSLAPRPSLPEPLSSGVSPSGLMLNSNPGDLPTSGPKPTVPKAGLEDLAAYRAELYLLARRVLEHLGRERGWHIGWSELAGTHLCAGPAMEEISLEDGNDTVDDRKSEMEGAAASSCAINNSLLKFALEARESFYDLYEVRPHKMLQSTNG